MGGQLTARWELTGDESTKASTLVDRDRGIMSRAGYLQTPAGGLFWCYHAPAGTAPRAGVLVCPPILAEAPRNYRREVLLSEALAEAGIASLRFHYRGAGNSDDAEQAALSDLVEDATVAGARLAELAGVERIAFVGTRLGAIVAAAARAGYPDSPLVLWEPVVDPARYLRDLLRARLMTGLKAGSASGGPGALQSQLRETGALDIAGYRLSRELHDSVLAAPLADLLGPPSGPLLVLEMNRREKVRAEVSALADAWRRAGLEARTEVVAIDEPWWFGASSRTDTYEARTTGLELIAMSADFLDHVLGGRP